MNATLSTKTQISEKQIELYLRQEHPVLWLALYHHRTHKGETLTFHRHEYLRALYVDETPEKVLMKSTQCGASEWLILWVVAHAGIKGWSIFYVLPDWFLHNRFVRNRFETAVSKTPLYQALAISNQTVGAYQSESLSLKKFGNGNIAFVSSNSAPAFTEYPADAYCIDELDECDQENIVKADERLSASPHRYKIKVGNPTIEDFGIDAEFSNSDRKRWFIKCPSCGKYMHIDFFKHIVREVGERQFIIRDERWNREMKRDLNPICDKCGKPVDRYAPGAWVKEQNHHVSGMHMSKMFSTELTLREMTYKFDKALTNDFKLQRFYNAELGLAYTSKGAKIDREMLNDCRGNYLMPVSSEGACVMGVDVGMPWLHVRINQILQDGKVRAVYIGRVRELSDLKELYARYNCVAGAIDALPEGRLATKATNTLKRFYKVYYGGEKTESINHVKKAITIERTKALDNVKEIILTGDLILPANAHEIDEYYDHMTASVRVFDEDKARYFWTEGSKPDHLFHAECYALLARRLMAALRKR